MARQAHFMLIIICVVLIEFISGFPYFNIILSPWVNIVLIWLAIMIIFKLDYRVSFLFAFFLLLISAIVLILDNEPLAEMLANVFFFLLCIGLVQGFIVYLRSIHRDREVT